MSHISNIKLQVWVDLKLPSILADLGRCAQMNLSSVQMSSSLQVLRHAFTYHWKLWTIPEVLELLSEAGFLEVHVWIRCMIVSL